MGRRGEKAVRCSHGEQMGSTTNKEPTYYNSRFRHGVDEKRRVQIPAKWLPQKADLELTLILWPREGVGPCVRVLPPTLRRRRVRLRRRHLPRLDGQPDPRQARGRDRLDVHRRRAYGWWPPTAASSPTATRTTTAPPAVPRRGAPVVGIAPTRRIRATCGRRRRRRLRLRPGSTARSPARRRRPIAVSPRRPPERLLAVRPGRRRRLQRG